MSVTRFISVGESLIDLVRNGPAAPDWTEVPAGGPMTTAIAMRRLGHDVRMLTRLGSDAFAADIEQVMVRDDVDLSLVPRVDELSTLAVVSLDSAGKASYSFYADGTAGFGWRREELPAAQADTWLHFASIAWVHEPGATTLREWLQAARGQWGGLSYDLNIRPALISDPDYYWSKVEPLLVEVGASRGIIKASDEDIEFLTGASAVPKDGVPEIARAWAKQYGAGAVVITQGAQGAFAVGPDGVQADHPGLPVKVVDTVGAGDAFMSGFLDAYLRDPANLGAALTQGVQMGSLTCERKGANPPTLEEYRAAYPA
jgi:fructokinase